MTFIYRTFGSKQQAIQIILTVFERLKHTRLSTILPVRQKGIMNVK